MHKTSLYDDMDRRHAIHSISSVIALATTTTWTLNVALAEVNTQDASNTITNQQKIQALLHRIPVFTIVDSEGVPFMVVGEDAKISCYFFTTFSEADRLLSLARNSVDQSIKEQELKQKSSKVEKDDDEPIVNPWKEAKISSVALDFAVGLAKRGKVGGAYFYISPAEEDVQEGLALNPEIQELGEGKVPLFYIEDFMIEEKSKSSSTPMKQSPLFFRKRELLREWRKFHPTDKQEPPIKVTELSAVLRLMRSSMDVDEDLQSIVFIPPIESIQKAKECLARMGKSEAFQLGKRILVL